MAVRFSEDQILTATSARRLRSGARASYDAVSTDTRKLTPGCLFVALVGEHFDANDLIDQAAAGGAAGAIVAPGKTLPSTPNDFALYEVQNTLEALGDLARFHRRRFKVPVGAVGGGGGVITLGWSPYDRRRRCGDDGGLAGSGGLPAASHAPAITAATALIDSPRRRSYTGRLALKNDA